MPTKPDPKKILDEAMQLDPSVRAFVAETLLESLDLDLDFTVSPEWLEEIRRRCAKFDSIHARPLALRKAGNRVG